MIEGFLLDENAPLAIRTGLRRRRPTLRIWRVGDADAPPRRSPDPILLRWCEDHDVMLITDDRSTMPVHLAAHLAVGGHVPGILALRPRAPIGRVVADLELIAVAAGPDEYRDRIEYVPL